MGFFPPYRARLWLVSLICAISFITWSDYRRIQRVELISSMLAESTEIDATSPTGYANGKRWLIVPEHNFHSYEWIAETQQLLATKTWRLWRVESENAPLGRDVHSASPYRWWLALIAEIKHAVSGISRGLAVEKAALVAEPILHCLLALSTAVFVARRFGAVSATLVALGWALLFPLAATLLPGVPNQSGLVLACAVWSVLPLLASAGKNQNPSQHRDYFISGVAGGLGLWISASDQVPILLGIAAGGIIAAGANRWWKIDLKDKLQADESRPWLNWAAAGAGTCLLTYLAEYYPTHFSFRLEVNHPLYGIVWIGLGCLLMYVDAWSFAKRLPRRGRDLICLGAAIATIVALLVAVRLEEGSTFFISDLLDNRLTNLPGNFTAPNFLAWLTRDGINLTAVATTLPVLFAVVAIWPRRKEFVSWLSGPRILAMGPLLVAVAMALFHLRRWAAVDVLLLILLASNAGAANQPTPSTARGFGWRMIVTGLIFLPGIFPLVTSLANSISTELSNGDVESLIERDLAHWITDHSGAGADTVILAPPERTASFCFYGGLRGLATPSWENQAGIAAAARIVGEIKPDTVQSLLGERAVTHIILPSWDTDLNSFARLASRKPEDSFLHALQQWSLPPWIRPLPYPLPNLPGLEGRSVVVLRVTDENNRVVALSRLAEYFLETDQLEPALALSRDLQRYPADLGALVAIAQVRKSAADSDGFAKTLEAILSSLAGGSDRSLPWDRRVSLAVVLAQGQRNEPAREQLRRCLDKLNEDRIRSLTPGALYRLQVLSAALNLPIADPRLRVLALQLTPPEQRDRVAPTGQ